MTAAEGGVQKGNSSRATLVSSSPSCRGSSRGLAVGAFTPKWAPLLCWNSDNPRTGVPTLPHNCVRYKVQKNQTFVYENKSVFICRIFTSCCCTNIRCLSFNWSFQAHKMASLQIKSPRFQLYQHFFEINVCLKSNPPYISDCRVLTSLFKLRM